MESEPSTQNPWLRTGFLVSGCVVVLIAALAIFVIATNVTDHGDPAEPGTAGSAASREPTPAGGGCRLPAGNVAGVAVDLGTTTWRYATAIAYPTSPVFGPGANSGHGFRSCYQHSAGGAVFAAANALAFENTGPAQARAWSDYMLARGPYHDQLLAADYVPNDPNIRLQIVGYRILSYSRTGALIDVAARASTAQETMIISCLSQLVWQRGDWRFSTDVPDPVNVVRIGDLTGYTAWSAR
ncbi:MAG: hypothetical protein J2P23_01535 [Microlunatus sp.]|nr:hypothetical protein [Microlunatus sp.]